MTRDDGEQDSGQPRTFLGAAELEWVVDVVDDVAVWLQGAYGQAYRTACLILHDPLDAEEAVQEAFLRVWRFRSALPADGAGRRPWLYRVVVNTCLSRLRSDAARGRGQRRGSVDFDAVVAPEPGPEAVADQRELAGSVVAALADLPEHLRVPLVLRYWAGLSEREIAVAIRRRPGTVKSRLHEARRRLGSDPRLVALAAGTGTEEAQ